jgi:ribose-phosphate pyrophosphokinase
MIRYNDYVIRPTIFPDGTSQVWKIPECKFDDDSLIYWEFENEAEYVHVLQLVMLLHARGVKQLRLYVPFMPYGRQDKPISNDATFALELMKLLSWYCWELFDTFQMITDDLHGTPKGFYCLVNVPPVKYIQFAIDDCNPDCICSPDLGAWSRTSNLLQELKLDRFHSILLDKDRDALTGEIKGLIFDPASYKPEKHNDILIVDDICDGGRTFIEAARLLKPRCNSISLYVTHGIFSKGLDVLTEAGISRIYTRKGRVK